MKNETHAARWILTLSGWSCLGKVDNILHAEVTKDKLLKLRLNKITSKTREY